MLTTYCQGKDPPVGLEPMSKEGPTVFTLTVQE
jgi:hypothetical protein